MKNQFRQITFFQNIEYSNDMLYLQEESHSVLEQQTVKLPSIHETTFDLPHKILDSLPKPIQHLLVTIRNRVRDPNPEVYYMSHPNAAGALSTTWGWLPLLALTSALGMLLIAFGFANSRYGNTELQFFFYPGILLIFIPPVIRLISPSASRTERIGLLCIVGICCYLIKVMSSPLYFSSYDEFLHWRTVDDIARSGHLFSENALLPVSSYYPGLEIVTNSFSTVSGLDTFHSGLIVLGVARLLMILTLFALNEQILKSARMASIATILYMANPHFLLFDSQFAYESLALPLATFVMFAMAPNQWVSTRLERLKPIAPIMVFANAGHKELNSDLRWITLTAWIALIAVVFTHHVTDFFFDALLILWAVVYGLLRLTPMHRSNLTRTALLGILITIAWIGLRGNPVVGYISSFLGNAVNELGGILTHTGNARQLFVTYNGQPTSLWERVIAIISVALILLCLPFGLLCLWKRYRSNAFTSTLGIVSLFYPVSQVFRFTNSGAQLTDRAAAFLFIPITTVLAIFITQFWPTRQLNWKNSSLITCAISVILLGGIILGAGPALSGLPGPYQVGADSRSIETEGIQAAIWVHMYLGSNNRIGTDRTNQVLMGTYGVQRVVTPIDDNIDVSTIFFSSRLGLDELATLRSAQIRYLIVDQRLAQSLPLIGFYFVEGEPKAFQRTAPIDLKALTKFNTISQINRIFDSGDIVIYDVGGLINAPKTP